MLGRHDKVGEVGFTLIELLVVISIIGYLSVIGLTALNGARENARDARRKSDFAQLRLGLTLYHDDNKAYPAPVTSAGSGPDASNAGVRTGMIWDDDEATNPMVTEYLAGRFLDPLNSPAVYYSYDTDNGVDSHFYLCAVLESRAYSGQFLVVDDTGNLTFQSSCPPL